MEAEQPSSTKAPAPSNGPKEAIKKLLDTLQGMADKGELQGLVVGFIKMDGGAAIQSTPISPVLMNHLSRLLDRRVAREYDRALAQANGARTSTGAGAVPESSRQSPAAMLPRKVRRQVEKAQKKDHDRNRRRLAKIAPPAAEPIIRKPPTTAN